MASQRASSVFDVVVIGGGVAGLSVAATLAGRARVLLLEREALLASHASGHNAAIYRPLEDDTTSSWLAQRSLELLTHWLPAPVLARTALLLVSADPERTRALAARAAQQAVSQTWLDHDAMREAEPCLHGGEARSGLWLPDGGVLDIHALTSGLAQRARQRGAELRTSAGVQHIEVAHGAVSTVVLRDGTRVSAGQVVLCAGAWAAELGKLCGSRQLLTAVRRHLVQLRPDVAIAAGGPVVWRLEDEVYYRPESGGVLASPCDQTPWPAEVAPADPGALLSLAQKLGRLAPPLASSAVQRSWACLRTFTPDRELLAGADPDVAGLHWLAGLGGRGMSVAVATAELVAAGILAQEPHPLLSALSPARFSIDPRGADP